MLAAYLAYDSVRTIQVETDRQAVNLAKNLATAIDRNLIAYIRALQVIAASSNADERQLWDRFYREAQSVREAFGFHVIFADTSMRMLFNTRVPYGTPLPSLALPKGRAAAPTALATGRPAIGDLFIGPVAKEPLVAVAVPGLRQARTAFLLLGTLNAGAFQNRLEQVALPEGWSIALVDSNGETIAHRASSNGRPSARTDGRGRFVVKSAISPWSAVVEVPGDIYRSPLVEAAYKLALFVAGTTLLAVLAGMLASRRLGRSVATLAAPPTEEVPKSEIREIASARERLVEFWRAHDTAETALRESERTLRATFEQAAMGIATTAPDGRYLQVNQKFCDVVGFSREELLGRRFQDITHPDDRDANLAELRRLLAGEIENIATEKRYLRRDDSAVWVNVSVALVRRRDGSPAHLISMIENIQARKDAEAAVQESEARFRAMIEQSVTGTCIIDTGGRIVYANPRLVQILGYPSGDALVGRPMLDLIAPEHHALVQNNLRERAAGIAQSARYHFDGIRRDGSRVTLGAHATLGAYDGRPVLITTVQDVTELLRAQQEIERTVAKLQRAVQSTIEVVSTIGELRDPYTHGHERRVGEIATAMASEMGLSADQVEGIRVAGYLHDVGKIGVPAEILAKPSRLSKAEFDLVKQHAQQSYDILKGVDFPWPVAEAALSHHERLDGSGYPRGLKNGEIILEARILAVADTVEAMASHRPYRPGLGIDKALEEIARGRATVYDPDVADACLRLFRDKGYSLPA